MIAKSLPPGARYKLCKNSINRYFKKNPWAKTYCGIISRCNNPKQPNYKWYGARGIKCLIKISELKRLWERDNAANMERPSIDRVNPGGHYEFGNCRFIEFTENLERPKYKTLLQ